MNEVEQTVIRIVVAAGDEGISPLEVSRICTSLYSKDQIRNAISLLWYDGDVTLGVDRLLRAHESHRTP